MDNFQKWFQDNQKKIRDDYFTFLRFPSVGAFPENRQDCIDCCNYLKERITNMGLTVTEWETPLLPVVFAEKIIDPSLPTILFYGHYDVQPAEPLELWTSSPFEPTEKDGSVFARGASDNKGQCSYTLSAIEAFLQVGDAKNVNIKVVIEGDEETGSFGLSEILDKHKSELKADYVAVVDCDVPSLEKPGLTLGLRGVSTLIFDCIGCNRDLHSGLFGGVVRNCARDLATAVSKLWDENGVVTVPGFYDGIEEIDPEDLKLLDQNIDYDTFLNKVGAKARGGEKDTSTFASNCLRPTLEINGFGSGHVGEKVKTIIPARARVMLSMRLVPGQDPERVPQLVAEFLKKQIPEGMKTEAHCAAGGPGMRVSPRSEFVTFVKEAIEHVTKKKASNLLNGASIPITSGLQRVSGGEVLGIGYSLTSDNIHAPDENFSSKQFEYGFLTICEILKRVDEK